ncbi:MAG: hypothetical protein IAG13_18970 [Deltaproteobacteria bacterium]|nr:hypothetical protein [Nannocystaceae bacterium]
MRKKQLTVTPETIKHLTLSIEQLGAVIGGAGPSVSQTPGNAATQSGTSVINPGATVQTISGGTSVINPGTSMSGTSVIRTQ